MCPSSSLVLEASLNWYKNRWLKDLRSARPSNYICLFRRPLSEYKMEADLRSKCAAAAQAEEEAEGGRTKLHLVVLGHVDAGKSTLMGRLLHELG